MNHPKASHLQRHLDRIDECGLCLVLDLQRLQDTFVDSALRDDVLYHHGAGALALPPQSCVRLLVELQRPRQAEPDKGGATGLQVDAVTGRGRMHDRLDDLFRKANVAYVIPRDINTTWLNTLPLLPRGLDWTRLLLQEVLDKYPAIGFKSISPDLNQTHDTLAAAFVPIDSPLQSFPDVVTLFMEEHHTLPMRMPGEDLRLELRDAGMLENGEMIYSLPKALNDYRFAWSNENKTVYVRGNK